MRGGCRSWRYQAGITGVHSNRGRRDLVICPGFGQGRGRLFCLEPLMSDLYPSIDPDGLIEYSVVYTDRSLNHMSQSFQGVMTDISSTLKQVYNAHAVAIVPGSGTYGMEAVARQLATGQKCLVLRNGWFSYRWTQIFE